MSNASSISNATAATAFPLQESALFVLGALAVLPLGIAVVIVAALLRVPVNPLAIPRPRYPLTLPASKRTILLLTYGTRGDVQPMVALAVALRQLDFDPVVCTVDASRELCERNGVRFESCGLARTEQPAMLFDTGTDSFDKAIVVLAPVYGPMAHAMWKVAQRCEPCLILSQAVVRGIGAAIAEKLGVAQWNVHFAPSNTPTKEFPPPDYAASRFGFVNKLMYTHRDYLIARAIVDCGIAKTHDDFRERTLGLPRLGLGTIVSDISLEPSLHAYSPELQAKPADWPAWVFVVGAFALPGEDERAPPARLAQFVSGGDVVYVGFGSMEGTADVLRRFVHAARNELKLRVVVGATREAYAAAGLHDDDDDSGVVRAEDVSHAWLFPRCACVVHHGGAGTTMTALKAGARMVVVPLLRWSDQPFWAAVVAKRRAGVVAARGRDATRAECAALLREAMALEDVEALDEGVSGASVAAALIEHAVAGMYTDSEVRKKM